MTLVRNWRLRIKVNPATHFVVPQEHQMIYRLPRLWRTWNKELQKSLLNVFQRSCVIVMLFKQCWHFLALPASATQVIDYIGLNCDWEVFKLNTESAFEKVSLFQNLTLDSSVEEQDVTHPLRVLTGRSLNYPSKMMTRQRRWSKQWLISGLS